MIIPITLIFAAAILVRKRNASQNGSSVNYRFRKIFPWFILGFLAASLLNTLGIFSPDMVKFLSAAGKFLIIMALTAVGLNADFRKMLKTGLKPMFLGLIVWVTVSLVSIAVQLVTGQM
jgi:uncharacterized membrane protein YadS